MCFGFIENIINIEKDNAFDIVTSNFDAFCYIVFEYFEN